jgi:hypothetical protein
MADTDQSASYPGFEEHQHAWEQLAAGIATLRRSVTDDPSRIAPPAKRGELLIIGSGIDSIGFSLGDEALIANADKVLFCVADPATVVWLKQLRPDALDLYVLYADDKVRYTTYMDMSLADRGRLATAAREVRTAEEMLESPTAQALPDVVQAANTQLNSVTTALRQLFSSIGAKFSAQTRTQLAENSQVAEDMGRVYDDILEQREKGEPFEFEVEDL